ncbi:tetratricopeptide repeat protein [Bacteroides sedimenti]|uniref:Tetratricopeptide SHNi-TPR domain-containing protein n=1 Tax=Bacteroides sedimenti TaxID=2136147 RepID=A0ABM8IEF3_9BACE
MKNKLVFVIIILPLSILAQSLNYFDSLKLQLRKNINDSVRFQVIRSLSEGYAQNNPDSAIRYAQAAVQFVTRNNDKLPVWAAWNASNLMGMALQSIGNYPDAEEYFLKQLKQSEVIKDSFGIFKAYMCLGNINLEEENNKDAVSNYKKAISLYHGQKYSFWMVQFFPTIENLARAYEKQNMLDSALYYAQYGLHMSIDFGGKKSIPHWGNILGTIYSKLGQSSLALEYFRTYLKITDLLSIQDQILGFYEVGKHFERNNQIDSAIYYGRKAFSFSKNSVFRIYILKSSRLLSQLFKSKNQIDSAFKYQSIMLKTQEFMFSRDKISRMNMLKFNEQIRQKEIELAKQHQEEVRVRRLQLTILAISIIVFIIVFLLLSRTIIASQRLIKFLGIVVLLISFEFIDQVLHPIIETFTNYTPSLMLLILVSIASLLVPLHYKLEKLAIAKLIENNNKIRLAAAKKTIKELDGKS